MASHENILVVEDNPSLSEVLAVDILPSLGYEAFGVGSGRGALKFIEQSPPTLMLLDIGLPDMSGLDVLRQLAQRGVTVPTIVMTAEGSEQIAAEAFRLGVCDYLTKPLDINELGRVIEKAIRLERLKIERDQLVVRLERQALQSTVLARVGKMITSSLQPEEVLRRIVEAGVYLTGAEEGFLMLYDQASDQLLLRAEKNLGDREVALKQVPVRDSILGMILKSGQPVRITEPRQKNRLKLKTGFLVKSSLHVPIKVEDKVVGILAVDNATQPKQFTDDDEASLMSLADYAAIALENARLYQESQSRIQQSLLYAHELEQAHLAEKQQRETLERMRSSFLNAIGHELRTPLIIVLQTLELLKDPRLGPLTEDQKNFIATVEKHSRCLQRMIDGLVTFARFSAKQGGLRVIKTPFGSVLDEAKELVAFAAGKKGVVIHDKRPAELPDLEIDPERVSEAIGNLLDNAIKFSPAQGAVVLETQLDAEWLHVRVIDRGPGIPQSRLGNIWESFQQMSSSLERGLEGLGLGLAMTRCIVEAHGGRVTVQSKVSYGSMFTISLPLNQKDSPAVSGISGKSAEA